MKRSYALEAPDILALLNRKPKASGPSVQEHDKALTFGLGMAVIVVIMAVGDFRRFHALSFLPLSRRRSRPIWLLGLLPAQGRPRALCLMTCSDMPKVWSLD